MGKKNKKAKAAKIPKKIAGVKVPKDLRQAGGMLFRIAQDPHAREVALAALTAALAARKDNRNAARKAVAETGEATEKVGKAAAWLGPALTAAAVEAGRLLLDTYEGKSSRDKADGDGAGDADRQPAKKLPRKEEAAAGVTH